MSGEILAILCAITWSASIVLLKKSGASVHPISLNLFKNILGFALMVPTAFLIEGIPAVPFRAQDLLVLGASGILGIGIADAMVLRSLSTIGAARLALVECSYSPFVVVLSLIFLGEAISPTKFLGIGVVFSAIVFVTFWYSRRGLRSSATIGGYLWGTGGLFLMAAGILMIKPFFEHVPLFWILAIRLGAGAAASMLLMVLMPPGQRLLADLRQAPNLPVVVGACLLGTYVSMIFWVAGYKYSDAASTAVLNQTATFFTILLARIFLKEQISRAFVASAICAAAGAVLIMLS